MNDKPLGHVAYGSIGHLPGSRTGPSDHHIAPGQAKILTEKTTPGRRVIVTEKLDGSCTAVARINGEIVPLGRAGWPANGSPFIMHHFFHMWAMLQQQTFLHILENGERIVGEWLLQAHGTRYEITEPRRLWVPFDLIRGKKRATYDEFQTRIGSIFETVPLLNDAKSPMSVDEALSLIGQWENIDPPEGAVWRAEREGQVDFLGKYVKHDKVDGCYLSEERPLWNIGPPQIILDPILDY